MYSKKQQTSAAPNLCNGAKFSSAGLCDLEGALARLGGDRRLLTELMQIYIEDAPMLLMRISNGVRDTNRSDVLHAAHLLAGLAANLGAPSVTEPAERLEEIAVSGGLEEASATVEELQTQAARLEKDLQSYR
jgi:HPt (histidine-containing phosphotransfer) domain-containing protein